MNDRFSGRFLQYSNATTLVKLVNNLFLGPGTLLQGTSSAMDTTHNIWLTNIADGMLSDPANYEYRPTAGSPCVDAGIDPGSFNNEPLTALYAYLHPLGRTARWFSGLAPDVGAYEHLTVPYRTVEDETPLTGFSIAPNPVEGNRILTIQTKQPLASETTAYLFDVLGNLLQKLELPQAQQEFPIPLAALAPGIYFLNIQGLGKGKLITVI